MQFFVTHPNNLFLSCLVACCGRYECWEVSGSEGEKFLCTYLGFFGVYSTENLMAIQNIYMIKRFKVELAEL